MTNAKDTNKSSLLSNLLSSKVSDEEYDQLKDNKTPPPELGIGFSNSKLTIAAGLFIVAIFFGVGGFWAYTTEISGAVVVPGIIKAEEERQTVQHLEGGIIKEIFVEEGDLVEKGQALLLLESSRIYGSVEQIRNQLHAKQLMAARLRAEKSTEPNINWPPELFTSSGVPLNTDLAILINSEQKIFTSKQQNLKSQIDLQKQQLDQISQEIASLHEQRADATDIVKSLQEELQLKQVLSDDRFLDKSVVLALRRNLAEAEGQRALLKGAIAENHERIAEIKIKINGLRNSFTEQAEAEYGVINSQIIDLRDRLQPLDDAKIRLTVSAPIAGKIVSLKIHSPGGVLPPGGEILDILPTNSEMVVECPVQVKDITKLTLNQKVKIRLSAFNARTLNKIDGYVTYISADREERPSAYGMQPFYIVHVALDKQDLQRNNLYVSAGMPATVFFIGAPRTILDYALEPLSQNFDQVYGTEVK